MLEMLERISSKICTLGKSKSESKYIKNDIKDLEFHSRSKIKKNEGKF